MATQTEVPTQRTEPGRRRGVLPVTLLALATVVSANASLNVALPSIARDTGASQTQLSWVIDAYALVFAALLLIGGAVGDRYGRRRALVAGLLIFGAGSAAAMARADAHWLIGMRVVLGVGAALVMPATLSTVTTAIPREQRARAVAAWAGVAGAGAVVGLLTSGLLLEQWSWRSVFGLNVVLGAAAAVAALRVLPETADPEAPSLDVFGALLTVAGLGVAVYAILEAPSEGWAATRTLVEVAAGGTILAGFVAWELRAEHPMLDPRLFRRRAFTAGTISITAQFFAFFGFVFLILQYLQLVRRDRPLVAAVCVLPMAAGLMPAARIAARLVTRVGQRALAVAGLVLVAAALGSLATVDADTTYWVIAAALFPLGVGMGLAMTPATAAITDALPAEQQGVGSAVNDLARELGGALGIAVLGSVLASTYRNHLSLPADVPPAIAEHARSSLAVAARLGAGILPHAQAAFLDGMHAALLIGAGVSLTAAAGVAVLLRKTAPHQPTDAE